LYENIKDQILELHEKKDGRTEVNFLTSTIEAQIEDILDPFDKDELFVELVKVLIEKGNLEKSVSIIEKIFDQEIIMQMLSLIPKKYAHLDKVKIKSAMYRLLQFSQTLGGDKKAMAEEKIRLLGKLNNIQEGKLSAEYLDMFIDKLFKEIEKNKSKSPYDEQCRLNANALLEIAKLYIEMSRDDKAYEVIKNENLFYCRSYNKRNDWCIDSIINELAELYILLEKHNQAYAVYKKHLDCSMSKSIQEKLRSAGFNIGINQKEQIDEYEEKVKQCIENENIVEAFELFEKFYKNDAIEERKKFFLLTFAFDQIIRRVKLIENLKESKIINKYLSVLDLLQESMKNENFPFGQPFKLAHYYSASGYIDKANKILDMLFNDERIRDDLKSYSDYSWSALSSNYGSIASHMVSAYLENGNVVRAIDVLKLVNGEHRRESIGNDICKYYIDNEQYDRALKIIDMNPVGNIYRSSCIKNIIVGLLSQEKIDNAVIVLDNNKTNLSNEDEEVFWVLSQKYIKLHNITEVYHLLADYDISEATRAKILTNIVRYSLDMGTFSDIEDYIIENIGTINIYDFTEMYEIIEKSLDTTSLREFTKKVDKTLQSIELKNYREDYDIFFLVQYYLKVHNIEQAMTILKKLDEEEKASEAFGMYYYDKESIVLEIAKYLINDDRVLEALELANTYELNNKVLQELTIYYAKKNDLTKVLETLKSVGGYTGDFPHKIIKEFFNYFNIVAIEKLLKIFKNTNLYAQEEDLLLNYYLDKGLYDKLFHYVDRLQFGKEELFKKIIEKLIKENKVEVLENKIERLSLYRIKLIFYHILIDRLYNEGKQ